MGHNGRNPHRDARRGNWLLLHTKGFRQRVFAVLRLATGWTFLWAFLDKAFALGFSTADDAGQKRTQNSLSSGDAALGNSWRITDSGSAGVRVEGPLHVLPTRLRITGYQMTQRRRLTSAAWAHRTSTRCRCLLPRIGRLPVSWGWGPGSPASVGICPWSIFFTATAILLEHNPVVDEHIIDAVVLAALFLRKRRPGLRSREGLADQARHVVPGTARDRARTKRSDCSFVSGCVGLPHPICGRRMRAMVPLQ